MECVCLVVCSGVARLVVGAEWKYSSVVSFSASLGFPLRSADGRNGRSFAAWHFAHQERVGRQVQVRQIVRQRAVQVVARVVNDVSLNVVVGQIQGLSA